MSSKKILYISDVESALMFKLVGIETVIVSDRESALKSLNEFTSREDAGIIMITDEIVSFIKKEVIDILFFGEGPLIFEVPSIKTYSSKRKSIRRFLHETAGATI